MLMDVKNRMFSAKLYEMERQYAQTANRLRSYQRKDHDDVRRELKRIWQEYRERDLLMQRDVSDSRSPAVAALAAAQVEYDLRVQRILQDELPGYLHAEGSDPTRDQAEAAGLYGEYAIDFAAQAIRYALLSALSAIDLEMSCEEKAELQNRTEESENE